MTFPQDKQKPEKPRLTVKKPAEFQGGQLPKTISQSSLNYDAEQRKLAEQAGTLPAGYASAPRSPSDLPGYDKLTDQERFVFSHLPGIPKGVTQALEWFNDSAFGKVLSYLDVGAELGERATGIIQQARDASQNGTFDEFSRDLKAAWYAGSLTADVNNIMVGTKDGRFYHTEDLPGGAALTTTRARIVELTNGGMSFHDATIQARGEYYDSLGSLALRAGIQDAGWHIILDPINYILPKIGLVTKTEGFKKLLGSGRATALVAEELAGQLPDVEKAATLAEEAYKTAQAAGNADKTAEALKGLTAAQESLAAVQTALTEAQRLKMTPLQEKLYQLFKLNPFKENRLPALMRWAELSPESKAKEALTTFMDNLDGRVFSALERGGVPNPEEAYKMISGYTNGVYDSKLTGMMVTEEGRFALGVAAGAREAVYTAAIKPLEEARRVGAIDAVVQAAQSLGTTPEKLLERFKSEGLEAIVRQLANAGIETDAEKLASQFGMFVEKSGAISHWHNPEYVMAKMRVALEEQAMQKFIVQFGVRERGLLSSMARTLKAAESLVFLKLNPAYPIRNLVNNTLTMIGRGVYDFMSREKAAEFLKTLGLRPFRAIEGFGAEAEAFQVVSEADKLLDAALRSKKFGIFESLADEIGKVKIPTPDKGPLSIFNAPAIEQMHSQIAVASGVRQWWKQNWKAGKAFMRLEEVGPQAAAELGKNADGIMHAIASALNPQELDNIRFAENLNLNTSRLSADVERGLGISDLHDFLGAEADDILTSAIEAAKKGELAAWRVATRGKVETAIEGRMAEALKDLTESAFAQTRTGGYRAVSNLMAQSVSDFYQGWAKHVIDTGYTASEIRAAAKAGDLNVGRRWAAKFLEDDAYFQRLLSRAEARFGGIEQGAKGFADLTDFKSAWKEYRSNWRTFFTARTKAAEQLREGTLSWEDYTRLMDSHYDRALTQETEAYRKMDAAMAAIYPREERFLFTAARDQIAKIREADKRAMLLFRAQTRDLSAAEQLEAWKKFNTERLQRFAVMNHWEQASYAAMNGDAEARAFLQQAEMAVRSQFVSVQTALAKRAAGEVLTPEETQALRQLVQQNATPTEAAQLRKLSSEIQADPELATARQGEMTLLERGILERAQSEKMLSWKPPLADYKRFAPDPDPVALGLDDNWNGMGSRILDKVDESVKKIAAETPLKYPSLSPEAQAQLGAYVEHAKVAMANAKTGATRYGEFMRDWALLNYSRRTNADNGLSLFMPYHFWTTHSVFGWALSAIDRPAMLSTYLRVSKFLQTAYRPETGMPSRLRGTIRVKLPFAPEWMGEQFIDPMGLAMPFKAWAQWYDQPAGQAKRDQQNAEYILSQLLNDGRITQDDYNSAIATRSGPTWERAMALGQQDDSENRANAMDVVSLYSSPHVPIAWAWNQLSGQPERNSALVPITRTIGSFLSMFGADPSSAANPEAYLRKKSGLPAFDKWDDYRGDRALGSMLAEGKITLSDYQNAITDHSGPVWDQARIRAAQEGGGTPADFVASFFGLNVQSYPEGEEKLRHLDAELKSLYATYDRTQSEVDSKRINDWYDQHPEYVGRRALFAKPEERAQMFLTDLIWENYMARPKLQKDQIREALGPLFEQAFLDKETRDYNSISPQQMAVWLKMMGGDPPGSLEIKDVAQIQFAPPEVAQAAQSFYNFRDMNFPTWRDQNDIFWKLDKKAQKAYKREHPDWAAYLEWRNDWLLRNPDAAQYLTDKPPQYKSEQAYLQAQANQPNLTPEEWVSVLGIPAYRLVQDGDPLSGAMRTKLKQVADQFGWQGSLDQLAAEIRGAP